MTLLGLGGPACSGKDAVADILEGYGYKRTYMSRPVEQTLLQLNPFIVDYQAQYDEFCLKRPRRYFDVHAALGYGRSKEIKEVRRLLEEIARSARSANSYHWIDLVFPQVRVWLSNDNDVVVTGIRYANELHELHRMGGVAAWVERGVSPRNPSDKHLNALDFDFTIDNTGTLADLERIMDEVDCAA